MADSLPRPAPARPCWCAAPGSPGRPRPGRCWPAARASLLTDRDRPAGIDDAGRRRGAGSSARSTALPAGVDLVVTSPGWPPDHPLFVDAARARHRGARRGRVRLAAARPRRARRLAGGHRHERQDDDGAHARVDPAGGRAAARSPSATSGCRSSTPSLDRRAVRRAGRRGVELPAALVVDDPPGWPARCSTSRPTTSTGTARWRRTSGQGAGVGRPGRDRQRSTTRGWPRCCRDGAASGSPSASRSPASSACATGCSCRRAFGDDAPSAARGGRRPPGRRAQRRQRARRGRAGPGVRRRGRRRVADGLRTFVARPAPQPVRARRATASPGSTTARRPTRTRRSPRCSPTRASCGSPAASSRASTVDELVAAVADRLAGAVLLGADRAARRRGTCATRAGCPRDHGRQPPTMVR